MLQLEMISSMTMLLCCFICLQSSSCFGKFLQMLSASCVAKL